MHVVIPIAVSGANANPSVCTPCGGKCCQTMPGAVFPEELDPELREDVVADKVLAMLESGRYSLDWWEGNPFNNDSRDRGYYLRPAVRHNEGRWVDDTWGGACTFHTATGCALGEDQRPLECRSLIPAPDNGCHQPAGWEAGSRRLAAQAWWNFHQSLSMFRDLYYEAVR